MRCLFSPDVTLARSTTPLLFSAQHCKSLIRYPPSVLSNIRDQPSVAAQEKGDDSRSHGRFERTALGSWTTPHPKLFRVALAVIMGLLLGRLDISAIQAAPPTHPPDLTNAPPAAVDKRPPKRTISRLSPTSRPLLSVPHQAVPLHTNAPTLRSLPTTRPAIFVTHAEQTRFWESVHPSSVMPYYRRLAQTSPHIHIEQIGQTDHGTPLELVVVSKHPDAHRARRPPKDHAILFVLNGIHAGEVCGIDATQMLVRDLLLRMKDPAQLNHLTFVTIPVFNVGGHARFHPYNRVNQEGPARMGFRANARGYNLNRDFTKADTANMRSFYKAFHRWSPHILIDNHTTNGADYQYPMTYLISELPNVAAPLRRWVGQELKPYLAKQMKALGYPICPYVMYKKGDEIKSGILRGVPPPRFSTGYGELFNTITLLSEAHMLKDFRTRVMATYHLMRHTLEYADQHAKALRKARILADQQSAYSKRYVLHWKRTEKSRPVEFLGYAYKRTQGSASGGRWIQYDRTQPVTFTLPFFDDIVPARTIDIPTGYLIPRAWYDVITRLQANRVQITRITKPTRFRVQQAFFSQPRWASRPYEGRMLLTSFQTRWITREYLAQKGDVWVSTRQPFVRYILEMLEPEAQDSFLRWGFFQTIFQQKEYFSPYLFEKTAQQLLEKDPLLKKKYQEKLQKEPAFASDALRRLQYLYKRSPYHERDLNRYPIVRVLQTLP